MRLKNLTQAEKEVLLENHITLPIDLPESELSNKNYSGTKGPCGYCGTTRIIHNLETSIMCEDCFYRECVYDDLFIMIND